MYNTYYLFIIVFCIRITEEFPQLFSLAFLSSCQTRTMLSRSPHPPTNANATTSMVSTTPTTSQRQALLGDDGAASERRLALQEETNALLVPPP